MIDPPSPAVLGGFALVIGMLILGLIVHELGHALAAHLVGFRVRLVRVGPLVAEVTPTGWRLRALRQRIRDGEVDADPVRPDHLRTRHALFVLGGPVAHLLLAGAMLGAARVWGGWLGLAALLLLFTVGLNVAPLGLRREGRWLDGDWLLAWFLRPRLATQRVAAAMLYMATETGQRPRDWDERWARLAALDQRRRSSSHEVAGDMLVYMWALDCGLVDYAGWLLARAFAGRRLLPDDQCTAVLVEAAFFVACYRRRHALAARLLDAALQPPTEFGSADLERARAAIQLAAGQRDAAAAACDRALALLDSVTGMPAGLIAFDRDQISALRDAALTPTGDSRERAATTS
jgi:peptidase M50-like protein